MLKISKTIYFLLTILFFCGSLLISNNFIFADDLPVHIVISEIQIGGESANDEFVELYNPMDNEINLENWDLKRKTKSGTEYNILNNVEGTVPSRGYFLIIPRANCGENKDEACYLKEMAGDDEYTTNSFLAKNNTILLYNDNGDLIDKVGWGEASDFEGEVITVNPEDGESLKRKGISDIIQDTDNNNDDFILSINSNPQNSFAVANDNGDEDNGSDDDEQDGSSQETGANDGDCGANDGDNEKDDDDDDDEIPPASFDKGEVNIIITEFLPNPEDSDRDNEFIEIYNAGKTDADLEGWTLEDKVGKIKIFEISENEKIKAGGYKAFHSDETRIALNNSGDGVILKDDNNNVADETPVSDSAKEDQAYALNEDENWVWTLRPTAGRKNIIKEEEEKKSDVRQDSSSYETENNNKDKNNDEQDDSTILWDYGTNNDNSGNENKVEEKIEYNFSDEIVISEVYPNPEGRDNRDGNYEWLELYNCSSQSVNLIGWQIDDILKKGSKPYTIEGNKIISAKSHLVFTNKEIKVIFNNSGDEINLLWPDGTVVDSVSYGKSTEGQSYSWANGGWAWNKTSTPNKNNIEATINVTRKILGAESVVSANNEDETEIDESDTDAKENVADDNEHIKTTIAEAKELPRFSYVEISGIVSTPPEIFSDDVFYIAGSGIQVYGKNADLSGINIGDEVEIAGQISEVGGEKRVLLDRAEDIKIISRDNLVESKIITIADIGKKVEGCLVTIEGEVIEIKDDIFFLGDGNGKVKIYLKPQTGIEKSKIEINKRMIITGQVSRTTAGYRILPRFQADLKFGRVSGISTVAAASTEQENGSVDDKKSTLFSENINSVAYAIVALISIAILIDWRKMKTTNNKS